MCASKESKSVCRQWCHLTWENVGVAVLHTVHRQFGGRGRFLSAVIFDFLKTAKQAQVMIKTISLRRLHSVLESTEHQEKPNYRRK